MTSRLSRGLKSGAQFASSVQVPGVPANNSFALSGSGWLMPFHVGVIKALKEEGLMNQDSHYSGTSGGSICALHACSELSCEETLEMIIKMSSDPVVWKNMDAALRASLATLVTEESLNRCQGRLHVTTTKIWPDPKPRVTIFSQFDSKEHLIECVAASCFIPMYGASKLTVPIGPAQHQYIDGGVYAMIPPVGEITISPFGNSHFIVGPPNFRHIDIHLSKEEYPLGKLLYRALNPAPEKGLRKLYSKGIQAAHTWLEQKHRRAPGAKTA
jgi:hypothetical protein